MPQQQREKVLHQEGQLVLAVQAIKLGHIQSIAAAARLYNVPRKTLSARLAGRVSRLDSHQSTHKMRSTEEDTLRAWLIDMDNRGYPLTVTNLRIAANLLLQARCGPASSVGINWPSRYIHRTPDLRTRYTRSYDAQRAKCEDPVLIQGWFNLVRNTIAKYGIINEDIYNFDETGFAMGLAGTSRVVTTTDRRNRPAQLQPGDREWATSIEAINATGWCLPPMLILKGKVHISTWYEHCQVPPDWMIALSPTGWTSDELGLTWLKEVFEPSTRSKTVGKYRLLILDDHGSHATPDFDQFCTEKSIITLCMPVHSSHLLQPLDVGCFSALKRAYSKQVVANMSLGINHIDKIEFITAFKAASIEAMTASNIRSGFAATGLIPYDPIQVLSTISRPLTPPQAPAATYEHWVPETPHNIHQLEQQVVAIKGFIQRRSKSPPTPTDTAINQLVKGCGMAMNSVVLLAAENERLRTANERQQRKRQLKRRYISKKNALSAVEGGRLLQDPIALNMVEDSAPVVEVDLPQYPPIVEAALEITCYICRGYNHLAVDCQKYK